MNGWMEKQVEERQEKDRKKMHRKTKKQRNISTKTGEKINAVFCISLFNKPVLLTPVLSV